MYWGSQKSYIDFQLCVGVSASNPHAVQGSTVYVYTCMYVYIILQMYYFANTFQFIQYLDTWFNLLPKTIIWGKQDSINVLILSVRKKILTWLVNSSPMWWIPSGIFDSMSCSFLELQKSKVNETFTVLSIKWKVKIHLTFILLSEFIFTKLTYNWFYTY